MEAYFDVLSQCPLFVGITQPEMTEMLRCLDGKISAIPKGNPVLLEGEPARFVGVVLSGAVQVVIDALAGLLHTFFMIGRPTVRTNRDGFAVFQRFVTERAIHPVIFSHSMPPESADRASSY